MIFHIFYSGITWHKPSDPSFEKEGAVLEIKNVRAEDGGEYVCTAHNYIHPTGGTKLFLDRLFAKIKFFNDRI